MSFPSIRRSAVAQLLALLPALIVLAAIASTARAQLPVPPLRQPAEFEPMQGVMIRYPLGIPVALIAEMSEDVEVVTVLANDAEEAAAKSLYAGGGVNLANCTFLQAPTESIYTRDWGPWFVLDGNDDMNAVDFVYEWPNSPGDDAMPFQYARSRGMDLVSMVIKTAGGNYMTDGLGNAVATDFVWFNNKDMTHEEIDAELRRNLGIARHHVLPDPDFWWFHIDCYAKFLSPTVVMVAEVAPAHAQYQVLEDAADYFERQISGYGTPFEVIRVFAPNKPYTNSLILNDKVLVPLMGSPHDAGAMAAYRAAMPGYQVLGFHHNWHPFDALHCRTKEIADRYMLYVGHRPLLDRPAEAAGFPVRAEVRPCSGTPLVGAPEVRWRAGGVWNAVPMAPAGGIEYLAHIPAQPFGTEIEYYLHAEDGSGRTESHPYIGAPGAHRFTSQPLGSDTSAIRASAGGVIDLHLDASPANGGRDYFVLGSASGTSPGVTLPGGLVLPLNPDDFMTLVRSSANSPEFVGFEGKLDASGRASAQFVLEARPALAGMDLHFAFLVGPPFDFVSNATPVYLLE